MNLNAAPAESDADPYLWLEEVESERSLAWARERNAVSLGELQAREGYAEVEARLLSIYDSKDRIPGISKIGDAYYNFWRDAAHPRGIWRRTSMEQYRQVDPAWEVVLDLDALGAAEGESWVWKGATVLRPDEDRCMISLSRGGADATEKREFDLTTKTFVADGFVLPEARNSVSWIDRDTMYVGTDFGPGSMSESGYPRMTKRWRRGTPLSEAELIRETPAKDLGVWGYHTVDHGRHHDFLRRVMTFFTNQLFMLVDGEWVMIDKPDDVVVGVFDDWFTFQLREPWTVGDQTFAAGSLLAAKMSDFLAGDRDMTVVFAPTERTSLDSVDSTKNYLLITVLDNVSSRAYAMQWTDGAWRSRALPAPEFGKVELGAVDSENSDDYFMTSEDFVTPTSLFHGTVGSEDQTRLKSLPAYYDANGITVEQHEATSADGTKVPYFQIGRAGLKLDGTNPTLLYGYGGFEVSMSPFYSGSVGAAWLERGGVYVLANIRGGGEFGPRWHRAALKENRQRAFDDFAAIAEHLIERGVTTREHLGIQGGSNGGLLMGVMLTQRPDLFGAVLCQVPLLDMQRYHLLLAGASWMGEYGDPDQPDEWAYIKAYSPYQNVNPDGDYPRTLFTTSTRDDRVHPGHARKMAALMREQGHDVLYYENIEGGHGGAANNEQRARMNALGFTFLWNELE
ncbi:prolyl oligopeptidase family serine peptidase [Synoicihabitans lomoniglobus]|uniref:Prolyl oligopeptidase family serine peptidase n=1 Tax=Synoicihabitans lomoniglobus TaxID=2909285 RepID=A0AAF0CN02_9BACT|nr:prolyl oligopeptidase family serine peptidase [Opitutaceae bacterium LMO-M01]WED63996.1 prolyl oligopeptidase family serine peptidase [Opitutaceae bacterium LMO-M01]